jgi:phage-related minor tail protein
MPTALTVAADAVEGLGDAWNWAFGDDNQDAAKASGDAAEYYGSRVAAAKAETEALEAAQLDAAQATEDAKVEVERYARAQKFASDEVQRRLDLERELYGDQRDAIERQREYNRSIADLAVVLGDSKASLDSQFDSALKASEAFATLNGATLESKEGTNRQVQSLQELTASLAPDSPLRAALQQYVQQLAAIPASVDTALRLNISQGSTTTKDGDTIGRRVGARASGGPVSAGMPYLVGERGPELVVPSGGGNVIPAGKTASMLGGNTTVNIYTNADPNSTKAALRLFNRRNGPGL